MDAEFQTESHTGRYHLRNQGTHGTNRGILGQ